LGDRVLRLEQLSWAHVFYLRELTIEPADRPSKDMQKLHHFQETVSYIAILITQLEETKRGLKKPVTHVVQMARKRSVINNRTGPAQSQKVFDLGFGKFTHHRVLVNGLEPGSFVLGASGLRSSAQAGCLHALVSGREATYLG